MAFSLSSIFSRKSPYPNGYKKFSTKSKPSSQFLSLELRNKEILLSRGIDLSKVRFTSQPAFIYDFVRDIVNPESIVELPIMSNGLFDPNRKERIVGTNERDNRVLLFVFNYKDPDWNDLKNQINNSKKGCVFFLIDEYISTSGKYHFEVDTDIVRFIDLDQIKV